MLISSLFTFHITELKIHHLYSQMTSQFSWPFQILFFQMCYGVSKIMYHKIADQSTAKCGFNEKYNLSMLQYTG